MSSDPEIHTPATAASQEDDGTNKAICRLCRRQFAKYTCPTCNVPYCSLACFRSSSHSQCSETFYKKELQTDITITPSRTNEERKQMMELLKRFEEEAAEDQDLLNKDVLENGEGEGVAREETLVERFAGLDFDALSSEDMWEMLTPDEREKFVKALEDPASELAQRLLGSEQLEVEIEPPWWINEAGRLDHEPENQQQNERRKTESRPTPIRIQQSMVKPVPSGHPLVYNLSAICIAYSHIVRHLGVRMLSALTPTDPDLREALRLINVLAPFLLDRRSTTLHPSFEAVITDVYSRFEMGKVNSELLAVLLEDTAKLMKPLRVVTMSTVPPQSAESGGTPLVDPPAHSSLMPILMLSDMNSIFQHGQDEADKVSPQALSQECQDKPPSPTRSEQPAMKSKSNKLHGYQHVIRKLEFYVAQILATPTGIMESVSEEALRWSHKVRAEGQGVVSRTTGGVGRARETRKQLVEEIG